MPEDDPSQWADRSVPGERPMRPPIQRREGLWGRVAGISPAQMRLVFRLFALAALIAAALLIYWLLTRNPKKPGSQSPPAEEPMPAHGPSELPIVGRGATLRPVPLGQPGRGAIMYLAYSPDGRYLAARSGLGEVKLWDLKSGSAQVLQAEPKFGLELQPSYARPLAFSGDGQLLAWRRDFGLGQPKVRTWVIASNREGGAWDCMGAGSTQLAFARGTQNLITCDDATGAVRVHRFKPGREGYDIDDKGGSLGVTGTQGLISPDGERLVALDGRQQGAAIPGQPTPPFTRLDLYDPSRPVAKPAPSKDMTFSRVIRLEESFTEWRPNWGLLFSPDGKWLATWREKGVVVSDRDGGNRQHLVGVRRALAVAADGSVLAVPDEQGGLRLITVVGGREVAKVPALEAAAGKSVVEVRCVAFSPDCKTLALGCSDGGIRQCRWR
jgi:WD40 repeat protein